MATKPRSSRPGNASTATAYDHGFSTDEPMPNWVLDRSDSHREAWQEGRNDRQILDDEGASPPAPAEPANSPSPSKTQKSSAPSTAVDSRSAGRRRFDQVRAGVTAVPTIRGTLAGALLGALFFYPLGINWLRGGQAQAKGWMTAKFFNIPYTGGKAAAATAASQSTAATV